MRIVSMFTASGTRLKVPVTFGRPVRSRLSTMREPTGSATTVKTCGMSWLKAGSSRSSSVPAVPRVALVPQLRIRSAPASRASATKPGRRPGSLSASRRTNSTSSPASPR